MDLQALLISRKTGIMLFNREIEQLERDYVIVKDLDRSSVLAKISKVVMKNDESILWSSGFSYELQSRDPGQAEFVPLLKQVCLRKRESKTFAFGDSDSARRVTILTAVLSIVQEAVLSRLSITSWGIYYRDPDLFVKHEVVDAAVFDLGCMLGCSRAHLNVHASSKGLFAGHVTLIMDDNNQINGRPCAKESVRIPNRMGKISSIIGDVNYILVVEKQSAFDHLVEQDFHDDFRCVIVTGCGQPDVSTRLLVYRLHKSLGKPVYGLVDPDPYGALIFCTYKYGSANMLFDNLGLATPSMTWIGVSLSDLPDTTPSMLKPLQDGDLVVLENLKSKNYIHEHEPDLRGDIISMITARKKGEIECIHSMGMGALSAHICNAIEEAEKPKQSEDIMS